MAAPSSDVDPPAEPEPKRAKVADGAKLQAGCEQQQKQPIVSVTLVACGAPLRSMGWYHAKQLLDNRIGCAKLTDIIEPFLLGAGKGSVAAKEFGDWIANQASAVKVHASIPDMPAPVGPSFAVICGRTADNPKLFKQAVDRGFKYIYLEKPGAPTVVELEEMDKYAQSHGVAVAMGFNRNYSQYVLRAKAFLKHAPQGCTITMGRNDAFEVGESLDECFERNREGMMKNMMIHELVALVTHFGLHADGIQEIIPDRKYSVQELRKGVADFSKIRCTLRLKSGREIVLWGDRLGGEYAEAVLSSPGVKMIAVRPDPEVSSTAAALEKETPGCMPFFYLQDGEYLGLKTTLAEHVAKSKPGLPEGIAAIGTAIEGLKLCDLITEALTSVP